MAVRQWLPARSLAENDSVLVFFAGHGVTKPNGEGYLAGCDADARQIEKSCLAVSQLRDALGLLRCRDIAVVLDCCYSGRLFSRFSFPSQLVG